MNLKNGTAILILLVVFIATSIMFVYQTVYLKTQDKLSQVSILVAKLDIPAGSEINNENIGVMKIDKTQAQKLNGMTNFADIKGKKAKTDIFKNEIITKQRVDEQNNADDKMFSINVSASQSSTIKKGDIVRFYVQIYNSKEKRVAIFELFKSKQIKEVLQTTKKSNNVTISSFEINVSNEEALNYYNAIKVGEIIALKYNDISEKDKLEVLKFDVNSEELRALGIDFAAIYKDTTDMDEQMNNDGDSVVSESEYTDSLQIQSFVYIVKKGDTWESIAKDNNVTVKKLMENNPGIVTLSENQIINIVY